VSQPRLPLSEAGTAKPKRGVRRPKTPPKIKATEEPRTESKPRVEVRRSSRRTRTVTAYRERDTIVVLIPQRMSKADEQTFVRDMVQKVLAREARASAPPGDEALAFRAHQLAATYLAPAVDQLPVPTSNSAGAPVRPAPASSDCRTAYSRCRPGWSTMCLCMNLRT
jgi:hypothetical protein